MSTINIHTKLPVSNGMGGGIRSIHPMAVRKFRLFSSGTGLDFGEFEMALVLSLRDLGCAFNLCLGDAGLAFGFEGAETAELVGVGGEVLDWGVVPGL
jgi:hypothetical protein